jgi:hypothetical protein
MMSGNVAIGAPVQTHDGKDLGKVKEVVGGCFKVDAPMRPDYWLATDSITGSDGGIVTLRFDKDELDEAKQEGPEHSGYHRHM